MELTILDYDIQYAGDFARINQNWIEKYFKMEEADFQALQNPQKIIDDGGHIVFAKLGDRIVGTGAILSCGNNIYEVAKMGVDEDCRGHGVGDKIIAKLINFVRSLGTAKAIKIETSSKLHNAIHLYRKHGFVDDDISVSVHGYARADVFLVHPLE